MKRILVVGASVLLALLAFRWAGVRPSDMAGDTASSEASAAASDPATACAVEAGPVRLPAELRETSGIARTASGDLWTHNDGDEAALYRVTDDGRIAQTVRLTGTRAVDIEDIDAGPCPDGSGLCLWLADTGDNDGERAEVALLLVPVPAPGVQHAAVSRIAFTYPAGARDAESLAVLPDGSALVVTKGRDAPIEVYRLVPAGGAGAPADRLVAHRLAHIAAEPADSRARVSGAGASDNGVWVALRTNDDLALYRAETLVSGAPEPALVHDLRSLGESQGEAVEVSDDGRIWLTSEGERGTPTLARLRCTLPE